MYQAIHCFTRPEWVDDILNCATTYGATGATLVHARGIHRGDELTILHIPVDRPLTLILMIVPEDKVSHIYQGLMRELPEEITSDMRFYTAAVATCTGLRK